MIIRCVHILRGGANNFMRGCDIEEENVKVFLGGTCGDSDWREKLKPMLRCDYFDPVVLDWNEKVRREELQQRRNCDFCLYTITPKMSGVYSVAEVVDDSNKRPRKTILCILRKDGNLSFSERQTKSLDMVALLVEKNGGKVFSDLVEVAQYLNGVARRITEELEISLRN